MIVRRDTTRPLMQTESKRGEGEEGESQDELRKLAPPLWGKRKIRIPITRRITTERKKAEVYGNSGGQGGVTARVGGRPMIRNRGHDGAAEEGGYSSGGGEVSLCGRKEDGRSRGNRQTE